MYKRATLGIMFFVKLVVAVFFVFIMFKIIVMIIGLMTPSSASLASLEDMGDEIKVLMREVGGQEDTETFIKMPVQIDEGDCIRTMPDRICLHNNCEEEPYQCVELDVKFDTIAIEGAKGIKTVKITARRTEKDIIVSIQDLGGPMPPTP